MIFLYLHFIVCIWYVYTLPITVRAPANWSPLQRERAAVWEGNGHYCHNTQLWHVSGEFSACDFKVCDLTLVLTQSSGIEVWSWSGARHAVRLCGGLCLATFIFWAVSLPHALRAEPYLLLISKSLKCSHAQVTLKSGAFGFCGLFEALMVRFKQTWISHYFELLICMTQGPSY